MHGGLAIYLKCGYQHQSLLTHIGNHSSWEYQILEILVDSSTNTKITLGNIYRLPKETNADYDRFMNEFNVLYEQLHQSTTNIAFFGDFNIDLLKLRDRTKCNEFFELMTSRSLIPKITLPTRVSRNSATLIDNAFCKLSNFSKTTCRILVNKLSDHLPYFVCFDNLIKAKGTPKLVKIQSFNNEDSIKNFKADLGLYDFDSKLTKVSPDENYDIFDNILKDLREKHFPLKIMKFNRYKHKRNNWITKGLLNSIKFRDKLYIKLKKTARDTPSYNSLEINLATYNKILKTSIRSAKLSYYNEKFRKFKKDIKNTWLTIKELINKTNNKKNLPKFFTVNGENIYEPQKIANEFNRYFNELGPSLARKIKHQNSQTTFQNFLSNATPRRFEFHETSEEHVSHIIDKLPTKTSRGFDGLSTKLLKEIKETILSPLTTIINQTIRTGIFPQKLKIARIVPVHKKDDNTILGNYRPISVLPAISKVLEKVMHQQLCTYFESQNLIFPSQYGFREKHNTEYAVIENIDRVIDCLENKQTPLNIFLDLSKAFDTLDHSILLSKLSHYGISGNSYKLCDSYLTNRLQFVEYDGIKSELLNITTGVPQGSILGPLFFLIYMNDFGRSTNMFRFIMYADDTTLLTMLSTNNDELRSQEELKLNCELEKISTWLKVNKLSLNVSKTKYILFHPKNKVISDLNLILDGDKLQRVTTFDFLGITVDECLTWNEHIHKIQMKIAKTLGVMNRIKLYLPSDTLLTIYNSLIYSQFLYGILLWGPQCNKLDKIQKSL